MPRKGDRKVWPFLDRQDPEGLVVLLRVYLEALRVKGQSPRSVTTAEANVGSFILFCQDRAVLKARDVTKPMLERYQRVLFHAETKAGHPLSLRTQHGQLSALRAFFRWLTRKNYLLSNPASELELPRLDVRLPRHVLSEEQAERILAQPDLTSPLGLRDRAILEVLYSTGIRRSELAHLKLYDVDADRGTLMVREGKGRKDRMVPIGERACAFVEKYSRDVRPELVVEPDEDWLFLTYRGAAFSPDLLSELVGRYVKAAGLTTGGACHLFRHAMATLMLENGADIRFLQQMLGHRRLTTTEVYTHVAIRKLKEIHTATHPGARLKPLPERL